MGTLNVRVTDTQGFLHVILLPIRNVSGLGRRLFSGGAAALKGVNTVISKESYLDIGLFRFLYAKIPNALQHTTSTSSLPGGGTTKQEQRSQRGSSRGIQYRRGRLWPPDFSGVGHGGGCPSPNSVTTVYRDIYGGARSSGATDYIFGAWRAPDQRWHHGGGFDFHSDYVFHGAHDCARAAIRYHYRYSGDADNCHGVGGGRTYSTST